MASPSFHTRLEVVCDPIYTEILIAELAEAGFEGFVETENGFEAFVDGEQYLADHVQAIREKYSEDTAISFSFSTLASKNWNEEWENSFQPVVVDDKCLIRASFHTAEKKYPLEIVITPKMSFGTGHHQTTYLMVKAMMELDFYNKRVMDAGCGTAILSIVAAKLGASGIEAFDIDEWSVINGEENIIVNGQPHIHISRGSIAQQSFDGAFDIILANINKNVLLNEMKSYRDHLNDDGLLLLSGFFIADIEDLLSEAGKLGLRELRRDDRQDWACLLLQR